MAIFNGAPAANRFYTKVNEGLAAAAPVINDARSLLVLHSILPPVNVRGVINAMRETAMAMYPNPANEKNMHPRALATFHGFSLGALASYRANRDGLIPVAFRFSALANPELRQDYAEEDLPLVIERAALIGTPADTFTAISEAALSIPNREIHSTQETVTAAGFVISTWANALDGGLAMVDDVHSISGRRTVRMEDIPKPTA